MGVGSKIFAALVTGFRSCLVSRVSCFVIREAVERSSRIGVARAGWVCSVFLVSWRGPGGGGSRIRDRASLGTMGPFGFSRPVAGGR